MNDSVLVTDHGDWVEITLNRPDRLNSFDEPMHLALRDAMEAATDRRAVLLTGAGRAFCAGQDLSNRDPAKLDGPPDLSATLQGFYNPLIRRIRALDAPVICAVNGVAAGAGANVALACDLVLAAEGASFIQSFCNVGLVPDAGGTWTLTHRLGEARAKALALTGERLSARMAADWGLIWKAVPDSDLMDEARALAARMAAGPTFGLARTKRAIHAAAVNDLDAQLDLEAALQGECGRHPDYAEGVAAFLGKRSPRFGGER
jgi:2-(1,2-epoxy-1,2-dihydrophenyl)acetyl-CoA isomerase